MEDKSLFLRTKSWKGEYSQLKLSGEIEICAFEMKVIDDSGSFEGTVFEDVFSVLSGDLIYVKGFYSDEIISLVKTYPYYFASDNNGEPIIDKTEKGHTVEYFGTLDKLTKECLGEWEIIVSETKNGYFTGKYDILCEIGEWKMVIN